MKNTTSKIIQIVIISLIAGLYWYLNHTKIPEPGSENQTDILKHYYQNQISKKMIKISGITTKLLADDNIKPRHQKFIIEVSGGMSLLITHNIDLAPRINSLNQGDLVEIYGQYEWNDRGGLLHWTHHDPKGKRAGGWIIHNNRKYE